MLMSLFKGFVVAVLLIAVKVGLEATPFGHWAERQTYDLLVDLLPQFRRDGPAVVLVDISHLPGGRDPATGQLIPTPRPDLRALVDALAQHQPLAIGIDIDFSPGPKGWISANDPAFLAHCLALNAKVPVRLGVYRGIREPRAAWLGSERFAPLAGALWLPQDGSRRLPVSFEADPAIGPVPSLGAALASAAGADAHAQVHPLHRWVDWMSTRELLVEPKVRPLLLSEVMVNFSSLQQSAREHLPAATPEDVQKHADRVKGRVVLIGDVRGGASNDLFIVPGDPRNHRGALLHAALTNTLLSDPLYEFRHGVRLLLDLLLSLLILVVVQVASRRIQRQKMANSLAGADHHQLHALESRVIGWTVVTVVVLGFTFVLLWRVVWLDFLLVVFFLAVHPSVEHRLSGLLKTLIPVSARSRQSDAAPNP